MSSVMDFHKSDACESRAILDTIVEEASGGTLSFPTFPQVTLRVVEEINKSNGSLTALVRLIQADPMLAANVVALSNSVVYNRSGRAIADVLTAVGLVGLQTVQALAMAVAVRQMASRPATPSCARVAAQLWKHSAHVAATSSVIARRFTQQSGDTALFAGIVHELGAFYLLSCANEFPELTMAELTGWMAQDQASGDMIEGDESVGGKSEVERVIGRAVLNGLKIPKPIIEAIEAQWNGFMALPPVSLGDTLMLADRLAPEMSPFDARWGRDTEPPPADLDGAVGDQTIQEVLRESAAEIQAVLAILKV